MEGYRKEFRLATNTEAVVKLIEEWSGEEAPTPEEPEEDLADELGITDDEGEGDDE